MVYKTLKKVSNVCQLLDKSKYPATQTVVGVTFTNNGDGTITANGTATAKRSLFICSTSTIKGHKYLLNGCPEGGAYYNFFLETSWGNDYGSGNIMTFTRDLTSGNCYITIGKNFVFSNITFKPQLFDLTEMYGAGNEPTTVEQFRQDFPDEMYDYKPYCFVKSYKSMMICKTKNLFPTSTVVGALSGFDKTIPRQFEEDKWYIGMTRNNYYEPGNIVDYELTENYIYVNVKAAWYGIVKAFKCEPNQTYTISCKWIKYTALMYIGIGFYDENGNYLSETTSPGLAERFTFTTPANCKWFTVCFITSTNNSSSYVYNIQLEEGSTPTDFVPNGYIQSYKKSLVCKTKNLFDISKVPTISSRLTVKDNSICSYDYPVVINDTNLLSIFKSLKPNTNYTISAVCSNYLGDAANAITLAFNNGTFTIFMNYKGGFAQNTFSLTQEQINNITYVYFYGKPESKGGPTIWNNIQIEEGDTATDYVPYGHL